MSITIAALSDDYSMTGQVSVDDIEAIAAQGFKTIINYRPDAEGGADQPLSSELEAKAKALGLSYQHIPVIPGKVTPENIDTCATFIAEAPSPILGFCRTGKRASMMFEAIKNT